MSYPWQYGSGPGFLRGRHYSSYADEAWALIHEGRLADAERLFLELVEAIECESRAKGLGVGQAYYNGLARAYREQENHAAALATMERLGRQIQAPGFRPEWLAEQIAEYRARLNDEGK